jgi:hypothetical protein
VSDLVRPAQPADDIDALRAQVAEREALLDERAAHVDRIGRELDMFAAAYKQQVGTLHEQLDQLELDIAEAELGELSKAVADGAAVPRSTPPPSMADAAAPARLTSDAVRALFRDVARIIHPDLADDDRTRDRRHALMVEANRAYQLRDAEQLRRILEQWERSPEAVQGTDPAAMRLRLERRLGQIDEDLALCDRDLAALEASQLYKLKAMVDEAAARGTDLIADMVRRLKRDILAATNRRDAMRSLP